MNACVEFLEPALIVFSGQGSNAFTFSLGPFRAIWPIKNRIQCLVSTLHVMCPISFQTAFNKLLHRTKAFVRRLQAACTVTTKHL